MVLFSVIVEPKNSNAQTIGEVPVSGNIELSNPGTQPTTRSKKVVNLPFVDDFSNPGPYPNPNLWTDNQVFINQNLPLNPPSYGVATFDGLNAEGIPYPRNGSSDTLTSQPIDLSGENTVYLSFYIQGKGIGFIPRVQDSLVLEGKGPVGNWVNLHTFEGLEEEYITQPAPQFQRFSTAISDSLLHSNFQFRFRNYSSNKGLESLWHIDYVMVTRQQPDQYVDDVSFVSPAPFVLYPYTAYPLKQLKNSDDLINNQLPISLQNNSRDRHTIDTSLFEIVNARTREVLFRDASLLEIPPIVEVNQRNIDPGLSEFTNTFPTFSIRDYIEETNDSVLVLESRYEYVLRSEDNFPAFQANNNVKRTTKLANYIAFDDGTVESSLATYNGNGIVAKIATEYEIFEPDSLQSVRILFPYIIEDYTDKRFNLLIYIGELKEEPDYKITGLQPEQGTYYQPFTEYILKDYLEEGILLPQGKFYIGWEHPQGNDRDFIPFGFDKNQIDANNFIFFDVGGGWQNVAEASPLNVGAVMMRPVVGQAEFLSSKANQKINRNISIFPNPSSSELYIKAPANIQISHWQLYDISGKLIRRNTINSSSISIYDLRSGIYFLSLYQKNQYIGTYKIIKK